MRATMGPANVTVGTELPELVVQANSAFAGDLDGSTEIFVDILTDTDLVQRFVTDWAGEQVVVKSVALRLGAPLYANDTLHLTGKVSAVSNGEMQVSVVGRDSLGEHLTATVALEWEPA